MAKKGKKGGFLKGAILGAGAAVAADQVLKHNGSSLSEKLGDVGEKLKLDELGNKIGLGRKDDGGGPDQVCPYCGTAVAPADRFCPKCGKPVNAPKAPEEAEAPAAEAEAEEKPAEEA